jgi:hypothetical protein
MVQRAQTGLSIVLRAIVKDDLGQEIVPWWIQLRCPVRCAISATRTLFMGWLTVIIPLATLTFGSRCGRDGVDESPHVCACFLLTIGTRPRWCVSEFAVAA